MSPTLEKKSCLFASKITEYTSSARQQYERFIRTTSDSKDEKRTWSTNMVCGEWWNHRCVNPHTCTHVDDDDDDDDDDKSSDNTRVRECGRLVYNVLTSYSVFGSYTAAVAGRVLCALRDCRTSSQVGYTQNHLLRRQRTRTKWVQNDHTRVRDDVSYTNAL